MNRRLKLGQKCQGKTLRSTYALELVQIFNTPKLHDVVSASTIGIWNR